MILQLRGALPGLNPHTDHLRVDLAITIGLNTPAGSVAQSFGAGHRAGHAGAVQDALATHLAIKNGAFADFLNPNRQPLRAAARLQPPGERN